MSRTVRQVHSKPAETAATRLMGALFGVGAIGFVIGPLNAYANRVGSHADALTFFISSILFTGGGLVQSWLAYPERRAHRAGRLAWRAAWIQSIGTLLFNVMTFEAISHAASDALYNALVWTPNALGSVCFLISGGLLYLSVPRAGWRPIRRAAGWWEPPVNLLGCLLFGFSAVAGFGVGGSAQLLDTPVANWTTTFGAACFLAVGLAPLILGMSFKIPRLSRLVAFEHALQREAGAVEHDVEIGVVRLEVDYHEQVARVERFVERESGRLADPEAG